MAKNNSSKGVRLVKLNWDEECEMDLLRGRGFVVSEPAITGRDTKSMYGIQSPLFASDWDAGENAFSDRYSLT